MLAPLLFALVLAAVALAVLTLTRGGPTETPASAQPPEGTPRAPVDAEEFARILSGLFQEMGSSLGPVHPQEDHLDVVALDETPVTGNRLYVRGFFAPSVMVQSAEVQATLDAARGEGMTKAVLVALSGFSEEASVLARQNAVDLIDAVEFERLLRLHAPGLAGRSS
jgi:hypothetical protein